MLSLDALHPHAKKNGPWSVSKLGVIEQCSLKFDWKYGSDKLKEERIEDASAVVGVAVHHALELALGGVSVKAAFAGAIQAHPLMSDQVDQVMAFYEQVATFVKRFAALRHVWGVADTQAGVMIERKWGLDANFKSCGFFDKEVVFRGVVDYALLTSKNNLVIVDHKTGKEHDIEYYDTQFKSYCLLALAKNPTLNSVHTGINFVMNDRLLWSKKPVPAQQIRDEYQPWLISYINKACEGLKDPPKPTKQRLCDWCGYKNICPAHGGAGRGAIQKEQ